MNYYIDFDDTLFNTSAFKNEIYKMLERKGLDENYYRNAYNVTKRTQFNFRIWCENLSKITGVPLEELKAEEAKIYAKCESLVHEDSIEFLKFLKSKGHKVYMLTYGDPEFQQAKVRASKLATYFDQLIFTAELKYTLNDIDYTKGIFIDDSFPELEGLKNAGAIEVIRMKRPGGKNSEKSLPESLKGIREIVSFKELQKDML